MDGLTVGVATTSEQVPDDFEHQAAALFNAEAPSLLHLARFYVDDKTAAEDLVQEAFIRLSRSMSRVRDPARGAAYLRSIVINLARDHNRRGLVSLHHRPPPVGDEPSAEEAALFGHEPVPEVLYRGRGCKVCRNMGYSGRMALYEVFWLNAAVRRMVLDGADGDTLRRHAMESGMVTLRQAGFRRAVQGHTTIEEILAVVADQE